MHIDELDDNAILKVLANRGVDVRTIREYSMTEINNEITRRRMEAERAEVANAEADADQVQADADAMAQSEAEAIAEDNARADQERSDAERHSEVMQAEDEVA